MRKTKKLIQCRETESFDHKTGEIKKTTQDNVFNIHQEPQYVKLYIDDLGAVLGLTDGCRSLLYCLVSEMSFVSGIITIIKSTRERFSEIVGVEPNVIKNQITMLCKSGAIRRIGRAEYEINPNYFAKGEWTNIRKRQEDFEMKIKYTKNGREITGKAI